MNIVMILLGYLFAAIVIGIIAVVGARTAYSMARDDYERDRERDFAERIRNAEIETRIEWKWIDETGGTR